MDENCEAIFSKYDKDDSGYLEMAELKNFVYELLGTADAQNVLEDEKIY